MTEQDKELLIKDLSARLLYNPWVQFNLRFGDNGHQEGLFKAHVSELSPEGWISVDYLDGKDDGTWEREWSGCIEDIKPYLRTMSSMTVKEAEEYNELCFCNSPYPGIVETAVAEFMDWLNSHHFDYRGLIEKDLALEAPEEMYDV